MVTSDEREFETLSEAARLVAAPAYVDGRQSERAFAIQRGVCRLLRAHGYAPLTELPLADGRRADVTGISGRGDVWIAEIKSSIEDFRADQKWPDYLAWCDRFYFAVAPDFPREILPAEPGLIIADRYGAEIVRESPEVRLAGARRKAVTLRFAQLAALRVHAMIDVDL